MHLEQTEHEKQYKAGKAHMDIIVILSIENNLPDRAYPGSMDHRLGATKHSVGLCNDTLNIRVWNTFGPPYVYKMTDYMADIKDWTTSSTQNSQDRT